MQSYFKLSAIKKKSSNPYLSFGAFHFGLDDLKKKKDIPQTHLKWKSRPSRKNSKTKTTNYKRYNKLFIYIFFLKKKGELKLEENENSFTFR